ncbi:plasmid pRiA4b ORF-3 family protein [Xiashengella succiniciproducens]|jgi:hypothetical protein|uniref:Plasmid pRiA4b ORF-3 family protein n=1 Tax=Xiashengella succiniciproducens TaxID=2949635 RepID=A0A9J6ZPJ3_9BACT|nr:plasmid pRiA4b ORF-3 family protein [Alkaliflexus sp. Ai-910]MDI9539114.1 plasmid pRiA4b ORF-3 family protein [Bacteroidota bacterium]URW79176.1 plasmid pRiA4b ORF-3 family protein [Alkaliflexus sp. Ai-910]HHU01308.1 plasmid pRiA4b ORF-3 family protein [Bacteroidales bacterium]
MIKVPDIYQIKIELREIKPSVWRRLLVPDDLFLHDLHKVIQTAMGWENTHMHQYEKNGRIFGIGDEDYSNMPNFMDYTSIRLKDILKKRDDSFQYVYDLGDYWIHDVVLEDIHEPENTAIYPVCVDGERNCPPEDCGGPQGYQQMLKVLNHPGHPDREELMEWLDYDWDADEFDIDYVNSLLLEDDFGCLPMID